MNIKRGNKMKDWNVKKTVTTIYEKSVKSEKPSTAIANSKRKGKWRTAEVFEEYSAEAQDRLIGFQRERKTGR